MAVEHNRRDRAEPNYARASEDADQEDAADWERNLALRRYAAQRRKAASASPETELRALILRGIRDATAGHEAQKYHEEEVRGIAGTVSDWWHDIRPPSIMAWNNAKHSFEGAERALEAGELKNAQCWLELGQKELSDVQLAWNTYMKSTIAGAEDSARTVRDGTIVLGAGLVTGGLGYAALGGGALGAAGGTLAGVTVGTRTAAETPTFGAATRGTIAEIRRDGVVNNLKLAAHGTAGIVMGIGEGLSNIPAGLVKTAQTLRTLFVDPAQFVADLTKLSDAVEQLWEHRQELMRSFAQLEPTQQSYAVGRWVGQLEALLIAAEAGRAMGGGLQGGLPLNLGVTGTSGEGGSAALSFVNQIVQLQADVQGLAPAAAVVTAAGLGGAFQAAEPRLFSEASRDRGAEAPQALGGEKSRGVDYPVKKSAVELDPIQPEGEGAEELERWRVRLLVRKPNGEEVQLGTSGVVLDAQGRPAGLRLALDSRFEYEGVNYKVRIIDDVTGKPVSLTDMALDENIRSFKATFGVEPKELKARLWYDNKLYFQREFFAAVKQGMSPERAKLVAVQKIPFGIHRTKLGYSDFYIRLEGTVEVDLGPPFGRQFVPKEIEVSAKQALTPSRAKPR